MKIYDQSVEDEPDHSILLNIFWPETDMPDARCGDVIIAFALRVSLALHKLDLLCTNPWFRYNTIWHPTHCAPTRRQTFTYMSLGKFPSLALTPPKLVGRQLEAELAANQAKLKMSLSAPYTAPSTRREFHPKMSSKS